MGLIVKLLISFRNYTDYTQDSYTRHHLITAELPVYISRLV